MPRPLIVTPAPARAPGAWFDQAEVDRVVAFCRMLRQTKGKWRGVPLEILEWQLHFIVAPIFGWKYADGSRIVRTAWIEIPRKSGKSTMAAALGLYLFSADREPGAEVYAAAADKQQARRVFDDAADYVRQSAKLSSRITVQKSVLIFPKTGSVFRVLSSDAALQHGLNVHGAVIDEVHVHKRRDLVDALESGTGARDKPLVIFITTADDGDEHSIYAEKREYAEKVASGVIEDPSFYAAIYAAREDADWTAEQTWERANPSIDVTVKRDYLRRECAHAQASPGKQNVFKRLHLNIRTKQTTRWIDLATWDANAGLVDEQLLAGRECYGGLDLSATTDLTAFELIFPGVEDDELGPIDHILSWFWLPEERVEELTRSTKVPYDRWVREGLVRATEGNAVSYADVEATLRTVAERFDLRSVGYDPWNAPNVAQNLEADGIEMVALRQNFANLSPPAKELEVRLLRRRLRHGGHPVLRWMADVVEVIQNPNGDIRPVKPHRLKSSKRIDGIVALLDAIAVQTLHTEEEPAVMETS